MKRHYLINPVAGSGKCAVEIIEKIKAECASNENSTLYITKSSSDAERYCEEISRLPGEHKFIVCGGDGTVGEALNGIAGRENSSLAIIPIGTGNDFVRNFCKDEADSDLFFDLDALSEGSDYYVDYLDVTVNGEAHKLSVNMLNTGFDSEVADKMNGLRQNKFVPQKFAYIAALVQKFVTKPTVKAEIEIDGEIFDMQERMLIAMGNGAYCGGGFKAAARAELADGLIDVCVVRNVKRLDFLRLVGPYKAGKHIDNEKIAPFFTYKKCKNIKIRFDKPQKVSFDGEIEICESLDISVVPRGLRLTLPRGVDTSILEECPDEEKEILAV